MVVRGENRRCIGSEGALLNRAKSIIGVRLLRTGGWKTSG